MESATLELNGYGYGSGYGYGYGSGYGSGYGYGSGDGDGYGYGSGDGYGYGSGSGSGYGYGSGSGYGYGSGDGDGYGYGSGDGYGYGYGSGSGYGYGSGSLIAEAFADHPLVLSVKDKTVLAIWRSGKDGQPSNGGKKGEAARPGLLQEIEGPLQICTANALHGTTEPSQWQGERWWVVALFEPVQRQGDKIASLKRLIIEELK